MNYKWLIRQMKSLARVFLLASLLVSVFPAAHAAEFDDGQSVAYYQALKGKKVVFIPISMSFDLPQAWAIAMKNAAQTYGFSFSIRDPNWSPDAGAQALTQVISEKPDVIVLHNIDMQVYARLIKKAEAAGIKVLQINLKSSQNSDAYVGADWYQIGKRQAEIAVRQCGKGSGRNGQVAIMQGTPTNPNNAIALAGVMDVFKANPEIKVVSNQSADWDAGKAHAIASTVLKQNPDLCAFVGMWEVMDAGSAAAVKEAGKAGKVNVITNGGGRTPACDAIKAGEFTGYVSYDIPDLTRDLIDSLKILLQSDSKSPVHFALYTPLVEINKANMTAKSCWSMDEIKSMPF